MKKEAKKVAENAGYKQSPDGVIIPTEEDDKKLKPVVTTADEDKIENKR